ncbi:hypothetical protein MG293_000475 [Ovis ammon polii]|uniref:Uncharacterized protein n=1 Tax=Ovis ammon polii TaxID=230172 RepID=A0AAD4UPV3_OVIAM|nr:hypothetical protein MG293_000475 [Ovis ammon polii]
MGEVGTLRFPPLSMADQTEPTLCENNLNGYSAHMPERQEHWSRLPCPSPTMKVKSENEVTQSCPTLNDPMDCSPPGSSIHGISQARVLEWGAIAFSEYKH